MDLESEKGLIKINKELPEVFHNKSYF